MLAHDPLQFAVLLTLGIIMAFVMDYGVYLALTASALFPIFSYLRTGDLLVFAVTAVAGGLIIGMHWSNFRRARTGEDPIHVRNGLKHIFGKKN